MYTTYKDTILELPHQTGNNVTGDVSPALKSYYGKIPNSQYNGMLFVAAATLLPTAAFVFMEIVRHEDKKSGFETYLEGISLLLLACAWIPAVCVATTPGGFAVVSS